MESDQGLNSGKSLDKGKGIDKEAHPFYEGNKDVSTGIFEDEIQSSDNKGKDVASAIEPPFAI
jgi:hypothetical protein